MASEDSNLSVFNKVEPQVNSDSNSTLLRMTNEQTALARTDGAENSPPKISTSAVGNDSVQVEELPPNSTTAHQCMDHEINELIRILDSDASRDEKLEALRQIDEYAKTRTDIRIEMDEEESDTESIDSAGSDSFGDIPLPVQPDGIPLPVETAPTSPLDLIPLPVSSSSVDKTQSGTSDTNQLQPEANLTAVQNEITASLRSTSVKTSSINSVLHTTASLDTSAALLAKTTLGTITVHLKGKLSSRISKSSVFDLTDENAKEVNRKLARLRKLKRNKKSKDMVEPPVVNDSTLSVAERRILEWKQELFKEQSQRRGRVSISEVSSSAPVAGQVESTVSSLVKSESTSTALLTGFAKGSGMSSAVEVPSTSVSAQDDATVNKLLKSFLKVKNRDDTTDLDWPVEMVKSTATSPNLVYCCNPLYFSFKHLYGKLNSKIADVQDPDKLHGTKRKYHKHEKHPKKKKVQQDAVSSSTNETKVERKKKSKSNDDKPDDGNTVEDQTAVEGCEGKDNVKVSLKSENSSKTEKKGTRQSRKSGKVDSSLKKSPDKLKPGPSGTDIENDCDPEKIVKDTGKSRWDTSSDSEMDTTSLKAESKQTKLQKGIRNLAQPPTRKSSVSAVGSGGGKQSDSKKDLRHRDDKKTADRGRESSERRSGSHRRRSYHHSDDESDSSYSSSCSRYSSSRSKSSVSRSRSRSSYYRRRRRRRSSVYSDSDSNSDYHRRSSRSYSHSRSYSNRRRRTRSYSSYSSRSSSRSYSGRRRRSRSRSHRRVTSPVRRSSPPAWKGKQSTSTSVGIKAKPVVSTLKANTLPAEKAAVPREEATPVSNEDTSKLVNAEQSQDKTCSESNKEDLTDIPTPEEHMRSIPLPQRSSEGRDASFIGPVLPNDHPLARTQAIPLPPTEKFQHIGPNDPLVFRANPPLPPPGSDTRSVGRPPSPPSGEDNVDMEDDIAGDEEPIPRMLDVGSLQPAIFLTPDQLDQYQTLQRRAELHARRQQILQETGMDVVDMEEAETDVTEEQRMQQAMLEQLLLEQSQATLIPAVAQTPVIHVPQQQMLASAAQSPMTMMVVTSNGNQFMVATSTGQFVQMPMIQGSANNGGLLNIGGTQMVIPQAGAPIMLSSSAAAAAFARAQDEAEAAAELEVHKQIQAARLAAASAAAHRQTEWIQVVQMPGGQLAMAPAPGPLHHVGHQILRGGTPTLIRSAGIPIHSLQMQQMQMQHHINQLNQQQQAMVHLQGGGGMVSLPAGMIGGVQMVAQQPQPAQYLMGPNGTLLRLIR